MGHEGVGLKRGVVIVMNPQTGEILAMVSLPTYDNNLFARGISNKAIPGARQEPGQAAAEPRGAGALPARAPPTSSWPGPAGSPTGRSPPTTQIATKGYLTIGGDQVLRLEPPRLRVRATSTAASATRATRSSSRSAGMLGIDRLGYWANQYGFGAPTGHRPARRGRPASSRRTSGSWTRSARRSSPARPTRPASARATTRSRRSS